MDLEFIIFIKLYKKYDGEFELSMEKNTAAAHAALHKNL